MGEWEGWQILSSKSNCRYKIAKKEINTFFIAIEISKDQTAT